MTIGDEQTIHHITRFNRVATGSTDDVAGATGSPYPLDCDSAGLIGFENRSLVANAVVLANPGYRSTRGARHRSTRGYCR